MSLVFIKRVKYVKKESIDILRIIENDLPMKSVLFSSGYPGINDPQEEQMIRGILQKDSQQSSVLEKILSF